MTSERTKLYKDKQNAKLMGVCAGIADYTGVNAIWIRLAFIVALLSGILSPVIIPLYFIMGLLLNRKPAHLYVDAQESKYWQGVRQNPKRTAREIRSRMKDVDRRLASVEAHYVSNNPRLTAEIERLR
ncbi:envelope stress response membrane protein PspC [Paraurantiacibacter namhicola]|uniref:DNA-binding transcriptional activator PspC n=1 Tax=Paraurantiacibacter namhicola TaxID=645517 RepID=A0A1C7DAP2_9SPHN|nr:envelope stress response membrane protein PspC [Paraurantiacibacter namhicola]ANU08487.1 DNA-binding transcriptional activator PspC [Paraurantiacibacter namhicola]